MGKIWLVTKCFKCTRTSKPSKWQHFLSSKAECFKMDRKQMSVQNKKWAEGFLYAIIQLPGVHFHLWKQVFLFFVFTLRTLVALRAVAAHPGSYFTCSFHPYVAMLYVHIHLCNWSHICFPRTSSLRCIQHLVVNQDILQQHTNMCTRQLMCAQCLGGWRCSHEMSSVAYRQNLDRSATKAWDAGFSDVWFVQMIKFLYRKEVCISQMESLWKFLVAGHSSSEGRKENRRK